METTVALKTYFFHNSDLKMSKVRFAEDADPAGQEFDQNQENILNFDIFFFKKIIYENISYNLQ